MWRHFPVCSHLFTLQTQFWDRKLSNIKDINYSDLCEFLQTTDRVVDSDGHSPQQVDPIVPVVQDGQARAHFVEASGPPTVSGCRYNNFIMWRRRAATWGLDFREVLVVEAFKKPLLSTGYSEIRVRNCTMNCSENCSDVGIMPARASCLQQRIIWITNLHRTRRMFVFEDDGLQKLSVKPPKTIYRTFN